MVSDLEWAMLGLARSIRLTCLRFSPNNAFSLSIRPKWNYLPGSSCLKWLSTSPRLSGFPALVNTTE